MPDAWAIACKIALRRWFQRGEVEALQVHVADSDVLRRGTRFRAARGFSAPRTPPALLTPPRPAEHEDPPMPSARLSHQVQPPRTKARPATQPKPGGITRQSWSSTAGDRAHLRLQEHKARALQVPAGCPAAMAGRVSRNRRADRPRQLQGTS